jgi:hypothetical protein
MAVRTAVDGEGQEPPPSGCACCGNPLPEAMVPLGCRPDVAVCHDCVRWLGRQRKAHRREWRRMARRIGRRRYLGPRRARHRC